MNRTVLTLTLGMAMTATVLPAQVPGCPTNIPTHVLGQLENQELRGSAHIDWSQIGTNYEQALTATRSQIAEYERLLRETENASAFSETQKAASLLRDGLRVTRAVEQVLLCHTGSTRQGPPGPGSFSGTIPANPFSLPEFRQPERVSANKGGYDDPRGRQIQGAGDDLASKLRGANAPDLSGAIGDALNKDDKEDPFGHLEEEDGPGCKATIEIVLDVDPASGRRTFLATVETNVPAADVSFDVVASGTIGSTVVGSGSVETIAGQGFVSSPTDSSGYSACPARDESLNKLQANWSRLAQKHEIFSEHIGTLRELRKELEAQRFIAGVGYAALAVKQVCEGIEAALGFRLGAAAIDVAKCLTVPAAKRLFEVPVSCLKDPQDCESAVLQEHARLWIETAACSSHAVLSKVGSVLSAADSALSAKENIETGIDGLNYWETSTQEIERLERLMQQAQAQLNSLSSSREEIEAGLAALETACSRAAAETAQLRATNVRCSPIATPNPLH